MANYTIELYELINAFGTDWMNDYPIFDEAHREHLNSLIIDTYLIREIAHETHIQFFRRFKTHMRMNMPAFNELYKTQLIEFDPFVTTKLVTDSDSEAKQNMTSSGNSASSSKSSSLSESNTDTETEGLNIGYNFPQTRLAGNKDYATSAGEATSSSVANTGASESGSGSAESEETRKMDTEGTDKSKSVTLGYTGIPSELITAVRKAVINVDKMVVESIEPLFMGVWGTSNNLLGRNLY